MYGRPYEIYAARKTKEVDGVSSSDCGTRSAAQVIAGSQTPDICFLTWEKLQSLLPIRISLNSLKGRIGVITNDSLVL